MLGERPNENSDPPYANPLVAYCAAKTAGYPSAAEWMKKAAQEGVGFDLFGSSNRVLQQKVVGGEYLVQGPHRKEMSAGVTLEDVVKAVRLSPDLGRVRTPESGPSKGFANYVRARMSSWSDAFPIVARKWP